MKVKISSIIENQFPSFIREEAPLMVEFIRQYFISQENTGGPVDLISNLSEYTKLENLTDLVTSTELTADISFNDEVIPVTSTTGFPDSYGLIQIDNEIITYTSKTGTAFEGCIRGFSGIYNDDLDFKTTESDFHTSGVVVENLSILFLKQFLEKLKKKLIPGFQGREFSESLNQTTFIQKSKSFYSAKGTDRSFEILFGALYGEPVKVIKPRDYLITPSAADYRVSKDVVVEALFGDPLLLENRTLFQDKTETFEQARGSISKVEKILRGDKTYYVLSLDYDFNKDINVSGSVFGEFSIHPKTQVTSVVSIDSSTIDVDSTAGFPNSGEIVANNNILITYSSKTTTQFFGCNGITEELPAGSEISVNAFAYGYSGTNTNDIVTVRVTGVVSDFKQIEQAYNLNIGDTIRPKSLGKTSTDVRTKNWLYNSPISYTLKSVTLLDVNISKYRLETIDNNICNTGDSVNIVYKDGTIIQTTVVAKVNESSFIIEGQGALSFSNIDYIERRISKATFQNYQSINTCSSNVQYLYEDSDNNVFISSHSLPTYLISPVTSSNRSLSITSPVSGNSISANSHGFITGDVVIYDYSGSSNPLGIAKGTYYVKKNNQNSLSLSSSRANLRSGTFLEFSGNVAIGTSASLVFNDFYNKSLQPQKLFRKISNPVSVTDKTATPIGNTGILVNGVEILNYKSKDSVFFGPVESIDIVSPGEGYDVINPPTIDVADDTGSGLVATCEIKGSLKEIRIIDRGLNYITEPSVTISGGNGKNAKAKAELGLFEHSSTFNANSIVSNTIGFGTYHGFNNAEKIIFKPDGNSRVIGISTDSEYFASRVNATNIRLHKTYTDAISGINTISITFNGAAFHRFVSTTAKTKISKISIVDEGEGYTNRRISIPASGINTATNTFIRKNHGYKTGEIIIYQSYTETPISGITVNTPYYVTAPDKDSFKLSSFASVGINTSKDFFFKTQKYVSLSSAGIGTHYFNYEPISVTLSGISGVTTSGNSTFLAKIQPIFRGEISSVSVDNGGQNYGQEDILNYNRQPSISVSSGKDAVVQAIVSNGQIAQVLVINSGSGYNSPPDILISGTGYSGQLTPIIENGQLVDVKINNPGYGYDAKNITLTVISAGTGAQLKTNPKQWSVNLIERLIASNSITNDDGILTKGLNSEYGLQYSHGYAPRQLRRIVTTQKYVNGALTYQPDLQLIGEQEVQSTTHSPIIGWAYDGNPIYGPYGYNTETGGPIRFMKSGYQINQNLQNRPNYTLYPTGFFVDDYVFNNSGDLDENNGRYCITPEFPNGTYAYFATISGNAVESVGPFKNYFRPTFPYLVGSSFHSNLIEFNFDYKSNQDEIELNNTGWLRNTTPLNLSSSTSTYKYLFKPFDSIEQNATVTSTLSGSVENIEILSGGDGYKIKDRVIFDNYGTGGSNAKADVSLLGGKKVIGASVASTSFYDVEFIPISQYGIVGFTTIPHGFDTNDVVSIKNLTYKQEQTVGVATTSIATTSGLKYYIFDNPSTGLARIESRGSLNLPTPYNPTQTDLSTPCQCVCNGSMSSDGGTSINICLGNVLSTYNVYNISISGTLGNFSNLNTATTSSGTSPTPTALISQDGFGIFVDYTGGNIESVANFSQSLADLGYTGTTGLIGTFNLLDVDNNPVDTIEVYFNTIPPSSTPALTTSSSPVDYVNLAKLQKTLNIDVTEQKYTLNADVNVIALTGVTTYFNVYGNLDFPNIKENDVFQIDSEKVKVLNVDKLSSRIRVERAYDGTVGSYHTVGAAVSEVSRRFFFSGNWSGFTNPSINRELYFNPRESLGIGIGTTVIFSNPGAGITNIFVPSKSIYFPEHNLTTGDQLTYKVNGGSGVIVSINGITTSVLTDNSILYAVRYSDNFIGISSEKVGIGTTGNFVGYNTTAAAKILYFNGFGSGVKHSLVTSYDTIIGQVDRNLVSIFTDTNPALTKGDAVNVSATPSLTKNVKVVYNKTTQRLLVNPRIFIAADIDTQKDTIGIPNHSYYTGQKILHTSTTPITGLVNNGIYYVVVVNSDKISLAESYYDATLDTPNIIRFTNTSFGTIFEVNPAIRVVKNNTIIFDVSDPSLSTIDNAQVVPAFDFDIFTDGQFSNKFKTSFSTPTFNVIKSGRIGIDSTASVTLAYDSSVPNELYYNLSPLRTLSVFVDSENNDTHNVINYVDSAYSGTYSVSGIGTTSFSYSIEEYPEASSYVGDISYTTISKSTTGPIARVSVISGGTNYNSLPGISSVISSNGSGAILNVNSTTIGRINNVVINDIGFDYPSDLTVTPQTQTPVVLKVIPQTTLKSIGISSQGVNYITSPNLVLLDGLTLKQVPDVDLKYNLGDNYVNIIKNSKGINNVKPIIVPINNSNSIGISSISFNSITKDVTIVLSESYSSLSEFPFKVGDKVLIENVSILEDSSAKGYNSSSYDYSRFTIKSVTPNIGFANGTISYNLSTHLTGSEYPGTQNPTIKSGTATPERFFPQFSIELTKNSFLRDETITATGISGVVQSWNKDNELLTISTTDEFMSGMVIVGSDSRSIGSIDKVYNFNSYFDINSSAIVRKGWLTEKGFLDNEFQRIQDSNYYQKFSYSLSSKVDYQTWNNAVSSLNHIAGFKKFSDLIVESDSSVGLSTSQDSTISSLTIFSDSVVDLNCINDFDLATENNYIVNGNLGSNEIYFKNQILQDYTESIGNRVLEIDNISPKFDGVERQFNLTSNNLNVFSRTFNGSNPEIVNVLSNNLKLSNHYFTNGEKVIYSHNGSPIGISTTTISGIGSTDKLPTTVFIIKYSESTIGFSDTAENALKEVPVPLIISSVGIGTLHTLTSTSQNTKSLISLGGIIQSPVVSTAKSTLSSTSVGIASTVIFFNSIANFGSGDVVKIDDELLKVVTVGISSTTAVLVDRGWAGTAVTTHVANSVIYKTTGDYNIVNNTLHFVDAPKGPSPIGTSIVSPENVDFVGITTTLNFNGRVFLRSGVKNTANNAYYTNYIFDDISNSFNGITSTFTLKSNAQNVTGISDNNGLLLINETMQSPSDFGGVYKTYGSYTFSESSGITSVTFLGASVPKDYDANASGIPVGGVIVSIGYTQGFGIQPLVAAGGTALVSLAGTITSVSIGNSGSGYRSGLQTVNVGIYVSSTGISTIRNIGIASVSNGRIVSVAITNPGAGYTFTNPPIVKFSDPLPYTNLPLSYVSPSTGVGTGARVNLKVGMGLSVIEAELINNGFGYKKGDVLSIGIGGTVGIPTISSSYSDFRILVDETYNQKFSGWSFGELQIIDSIDTLFDGIRKTFPIKVDSQLRSFRAKPGSPIDIKSSFLVFINGILQIPGESYNLTGSSFIEFTEAPTEESTSLILFYRGTSSTDVVDVSVIPPIKPGDGITLRDDYGLQQTERIVTNINSSDSVTTLPYNGQNVSLDNSYVRPLQLCMQTNDIFINQKAVTKDREIYEPLIEPTTNLIKSIGVSTTILFVENARTFFDDQRENTLPSYRNKLKIVSQNDYVVAIATATVSSGGTITSVNLSNSGKGYTTPPIISFANPIGFGTSARAFATASVSAGSISSIVINSPGFGYTMSNPPGVVFSSPTGSFENVTASSISGDFGAITGIATTSVGVASTGLIFNFYIPPEFALRNGSIAGAAITVSGIQTGYYFVLNNTTVGNGVTTLDEFGSIISVGSSYLNNVYQVANVSIGQSFVAGIGTTTVARVTVSVTGNNVVGIGFTKFYGTYSWGRIVVSARNNTTQFNVFNNGIPGVSTSPIIKRINPLKYKNYT